MDVIPGFPYLIHSSLICLSGFTFIIEKFTRHLVILFELFVCGVLAYHVANQEDYLLSQVL